MRLLEQEFEGTLLSLQSSEETARSLSERQAYRNGQTLARYIRQMAGTPEVAKRTLRTLKTRIQVEVLVGAPWQSTWVSLLQH